MVKYTIYSEKFAVVPVNVAMLNILNNLIYVGTRTYLGISSKIIIFQEFTCWDVQIGFYGLVLASRENYIVVGFAGGDILVFVGIVECIFYGKRAVGSRSQHYSGGIPGRGECLRCGHEPLLWIGIPQLQGDALVGWRWCRARGEVDTVVVEVELPTDGLVGGYFYLGERGVNLLWRVVRHEGEVGGLVLEDEVVAVAYLGGHGRAAVAAFAEVAGVVGNGLQLLGLDGYLVAGGAVLARVAHRVGGVGVGAVEPKLGLVGALHATRHGAGGEFLGDVVFGVLLQGGTLGIVLHPEAVALGPVEVEARTVVLGSGAGGWCVVFLNKGGEILGGFGIAFLLVLYLRDVVAVGARGHEKR